jgi:hypothetical protein
LLGLTRISQTKAVTKERMDQMLKTFKNPAEWPTDWNNSVASLYTKKFAALPKELIPLWKNEFEPTMFCVLSYAKIGTLSQRVLAIVQRGASLKKESDAFEVKIRKLYWL